MSFFNFKLSIDSYYSLPLSNRDERFSDLPVFPTDYQEFLSKYKMVDSENGRSIEININGDIFWPLLFTLESNLVEEYNNKYYPKKYIAIAEDYEFESIFMSLTGNDKGHIYYMPLEVWQEYVLEESEDVQLKAIKEHAIHVANSFTEFTHKLYLEDQKE